MSLAFAIGPVAAQQPPLLRGADSTQVDPSLQRVPAVAAADAYAQSSQHVNTALEERVRYLEQQLRWQQQQFDALQARIQRLPEVIPVAAPQAGTAEASSPAYEIGTDLGFKAGWKHGLELSSPNKDFRVHIGGRTQVDGVWLADSPAFTGTGGAGSRDAVDFRRARLRVDGTFYEFYDWIVEYDFVNSVNDNAGLIGGLPPQPASEANVINVVAPTHMEWIVKELPVVGNFKIGNFKEPIGMEHLTSSRFLDFMERSFNQDAFTGPFNNGFTPGVMIFNWTEEQRATWAIGGFKNTTNAFAFGTGNAEYAATGRLTWLLWYDESSEGRGLLHLGTSGSYRDLDNGQIRIRSRGSLRNGPGALNPVFADTGVFNGDSQRLGGVEAALVLGPLLLQSEYMASFVDDARLGATGLGTVYSNVYYVQALWFLTGEHREYERKQGVFGRVIPHENAFLTRGCDGRPVFGRGAWQLGVRYAKLDLRDSGIDGGVIQDVTVGLNWFLNPNIKVQWNYVYMHRNQRGVAGDIDGFGMRVAHDF